VAIIAPAAGKKGDTARKNSAESSAAQPLWVVQLGSFNSEANARILVEKLRQAHFSTHIETMTTGSGAMMYRVQTAPEMDRRRADETLKKMESSSGVHGIVLPHP
jgi:cell division septation protein DedD